MIGIALGLDLTHSAEIKVADLRMMTTEIRDLMPAGFNSKEWGIDVSNSVKEKIISWSPKAAEEIFLVVYKKLKLERAK